MIHHQFPIGKPIEKMAEVEDELNHKIRLSRLPTGKGVNGIRSNSVSCSGVPPDLLSIKSVKMVSTAVCGNSTTTNSDDTAKPTVLFPVTVLEMLAKQ